MQLTELRRELQFNTGLLSLIETLKNIAGSQYHMMERRKERFDQFMSAFSDFFRVVNLVDVENSLVRVVSDVLGIIVVTSDSGFMGGLNQGVIRKAFEVQGELSDDRVSLVVIGDKGASRITDMDRKFKFFPGISQQGDQDEIYRQSVEIKDYIVDKVRSGEMGKVVVTYPKALSFSSQAIEAINILPCAELFSIDADSEPSRELKPQGALAEATKVIVESSFSDMVEYLAGVWVTSKLFEVFEDSKLAEFSARAMHLEGSVQKVEKTHEKIRHQVFKAVHEQIDKGMRESHSAKSIKARKKKKKGKARRLEREEITG